ncbi:MAG: hypothetical protein JST51_11745 [Armatimonadetes bacterium]|nr:hypothetical protein [Armatimonadota bacterium]
MWLSVRRFVMYALPLILLAGVLLLPADLRPIGLQAPVGMSITTAIFLFVCGAGYLLEAREVEIDWGWVALVMVPVGSMGMVVGFKGGLTPYRLLDAVCLASLVPAMVVSAVAWLRLVFRKLGVRSAP